MRRTFLLCAVLALLAGAARAADDLLGDISAGDAALEERVRLVAAHSLIRDPAALHEDVAALEAEDARRRDAERPPTGLTDDARYLAAALAPDRDSRRRALEGVLDAHPDPVVQRVAEHRLEHEDAAWAERLLADDRHNRRAALVNDAVRPLGVLSGAAVLAAVNPFILAGGAVDSVVTTAVNLWNYNRLSTPEREALARYQSVLERSPRTSDAPDIVRAVRELGEKRARAQCDDAIRLAEKALEHDDLDHAAYYLREAEHLNGCADEAEEPAEELKEALAERAKREDAGRWSVDEPPRPESDAEARDYEALLVATALGDPGRMADAATRFREAHEDSAFTDSAGYALAAAHDLAGRHDEARETLDDLDDDSSAGRAAAALLASPDFNRLDAIRSAERRHARDTVRYVLMGGGPDGRTALYGAVQLGAAGVKAAESLGIFNVIGVATRAWQVWRKDPISNQEIIDRGETFLAREPGSPEASDVHERLADAYERAGDHGRALMHYRASSDPSPKRIAKLQEKVAEELLAQARRTNDDPVLLEGIVRHFGETEAADTAREKLKTRRETVELSLTREVLDAHPELLGPDALDLEPRLLDGQRLNGELADAGVTLMPGALRLTLQNETEDGERTETRPLAPEAMARARAASEEALYVSRLTASNADPEMGRWERYIPIFLQGSLDKDGGVYVYPGVKMRRYRSDDSRLYE
jgi:hypothetical protein